MTTNDLRGIYSHQERAKAAADTTSFYAADDLVDTFVRLREEARALHVRNGWPEEEFDREVPTWTEDPAYAAQRIGRTGAYSGNPAALMARTARARLALNQLAAAVAGNAKAIEYDVGAKAKAEADAKIAADASSKLTVGFA